MTAPRPAGDFVLRAMERGDVAGVAAIEAAAFPRPWTESAFQHELDVPFSRALIAHPAGDRDTIAGYLVLWHVADEVHLLDLAVAPGFRRRGLGRALAESVITHAREAGARLVTLEVATTNAAARALYEGLGFVATELRRDYYAPGEDAVAMVLEVP
ncbi:MAG: ribosomal protein S18-alanine N-acetyltransferase [Thermodesulfobacteriota bacterium]